MKAAHYPGLPGPTPVAAHSAAGRGVAFRGAALLVFTLLLAACGKEQVRPTAPTGASQRHWPQVRPTDPESANAVLMRAIGLVGTPYTYGGNTPESGFDCSGLVAYVYRDMLDLRLPRTSRELAAIQGPRIAPEKLATADLVFFGSKGNVSHVGIYVGEGRFVHAPSTGGTVRLDYLDGPYWRDHYSGAKRVLN
ncbi:MAG TPA: C40 family peptidase [Pseudoxanthomonas sp.]|nr:C40 family peptidase [Pseudoxanthomonas sp.]